MLKLNGAWRFHAPAMLSDATVDEFRILVNKIAAQGDLQDVLEQFKDYFAGAAGITAVRSSSASWAGTDLDNVMQEAAKNAPLFIAAFYDGCEALREKFHVPEVAMINGLLSKHGVDFEIRPPNLIARSVRTGSIPVPETPVSLDEEAQETIEGALRQSEQLLSEGRYRPAVQEILWLLETIVTAFEGIDTDGGTVQGKYFNKIAENLRRNQKGKTIEQVLSWVTSLHGYLSSPTGGGIRHGVNLRIGIAMQPNEARLFCNLIRSYIAFLIAAHDRLSTPTR